MSTVLNDKVFLDAFRTLDWPNGNDLLQKVTTAGLPAGVVYAYLQALIATPAGLNDQTIPGVTPQQANSITTFLKNAGLVAV